MKFLSLSRCFLLSFDLIEGFLSASDPSIIYRRQGYGRQESKDDSLGKNQKGSVFVYILMAVALIAALSYVVTRGNRASTSTMTDQQAKLAAQEIIDYGNDVAQAVQKLRLRGCSDTEISLENNGNNVNPTAPVDKSCHVFDLGGGGLNYKSVPKVVENITGPTASLIGKYSFMGANEWDGNGGTCASAACSDLLMTAHYLNDEICSTINETLGYTDTPEDTSMTNTLFIGAYSYSSTLADEAGGASMQSKQQACFLYGDGTYVYVQVLIAR